MLMDFRLPIAFQGKAMVQIIKVDLITESKQYRVKSPYNAQLVSELRAMKGARWDPDNKYWTIPICERNDYALGYLQGRRSDRYNTTVISSADDIKRPLFQHQKEGINFALHRRQCMLAFEMGLGKTLTAIEVMERAATGPEGTCIWWLVAPYGAQQEWKRQLKRWKAQITPIEITTYESLHKLMDKYKEPPDGVIFDESIKIKNPNAQRSQIAYELCRLIRSLSSTSFIILLSGAPAPKEPTDWWHQIECIFPGWLREGDIYKFRKRYAELELIDEGYGKFYRLKEWKKDEVAKLGKRLSPLVLVKHKKDCLELPDKIFDPIQCFRNKELIRVAQMLAQCASSGIEALEKLRELSDGFQYKTSKQSDNNDEGSDNNRMDSHIQSSIVSNTVPKNYTWTGSNKLAIINELLDFYHTDNGGPGKLVIYAAFHASIDKLYEWVVENKWACGKIDGRGWSSPNILEDFDETGNNYCIVANPACVHGLSFAKTECLAYYSNSFSVDHRIQSADRRDRPGMDTTKGTRIVDILNLETDRLILEKLNAAMDIQKITLEEIQRCIQ